jgi:hypothetical protein
VILSFTMATGAVLTLIGVLWLLVAFAQGGWTWSLAWLGGSFLLVGGSYLLKTPAIFGKRSNGSIPPWHIILLLPYLLLTWAIWHVKRVFGSERAYDELVPGVLIGRRLTPREWPRSTGSVLDLTSEFSGSHPAGPSTHYRCLPTLDRCAPDLADLIQCLRDLETSPRDPCIHCAEGHGRTGLAAAVLLMLEAEELGPEEAFARVKQVRPGVWLSREQKAALQSAPVLLGQERSSAAAGRPGSEL